MISNHSNALILFAKWPEPGRVKTRLSPPLTPEEAAELYRCMLRDTLAATSGIPNVTRLIFFDAPDDRSAEFGTMAPDAGIFPQVGNGLGERLIHAAETAFAEGFEKVAVIGTDSPHMPPERIAETFLLLRRDETDLVFGPTGDGGYYLVGMNGMHRELFRDIPWSSPDVLKASLCRAESAGLRVSLLAEGFDLDCVEDLRRFGADGSSAKRAPVTATLVGRLIPT